MLAFLEFIILVIAVVFALSFVSFFGSAAVWIGWKILVVVLILAHMMFAKN